MGSLVLSWRYRPQSRDEGELVIIPSARPDKCHHSKTPELFMTFYCCAKYDGGTVSCMWDEDKVIIRGKGLARDACSCVGPQMPFCLGESAREEQRNDVHNDAGSEMLSNT